MQTTTLSPAEAAEYQEFKRTRREAEIAVTLKKLIVECAHREADKFALKTACDFAKKINASGVVVSPVNVLSAKRLLEGSHTLVIALVGGVGESLSQVKKIEAKRAMRQGAKEIRLVLCYSALIGGNFSYLRREIKRVKKAVKKCALTLSLDDSTLSLEQITLGVRAAREGGADGICVRGEQDVLLAAIEVSLGKLRVDVSGVENAEQLRLLLKTGAARALSKNGESLSEELSRTARLKSIPLTVAPVAEAFPANENLPLEQEDTSFPL